MMKSRPVYRLVFFHKRKNHRKRTAREMILDIDKATVLDSAVIDSPVMGKISLLALSGRVKTLILMKNEPSRIFNASPAGITAPNGF